MGCRSGWLVNALYATGAALAIAAGWAAYFLRRRGHVLATAVLCAAAPGLVLVIYLLSGQVDGMGALALAFVGLVLFGPATLAAWLGALIGWWRARRGG